jgi:hypothetical protein
MVILMLYNAPSASAASSSIRGERHMHALCLWQFNGINNCLPDLSGSFIHYFSCFFLFLLNRTS